MVMKSEPNGLIGYEVPAADGEDYGHRVIGYDAFTEDYAVIPIRWSTGKVLGPTMFIDKFKISYRYCLGKARKST